MKERPILFNTEMVRVILDGKKTQTRRIIKRPKDIPSEYEINTSVLDDKATAWWENPKYKSVGYSQKCPYGVIGDRLWVRETWQKGQSNGKDLVLFYKADNDPRDINFTWKPSIYMPRWASRINLEITNIRVERVQNIIDNDALAEGVNQNMLASFGFASAESKEKFNFTQAIKTYKLLWNSINAKRGFGWDANPWVWVIEFKRV